MLILDLTTPSCPHVYSFTSHHDAFWRHPLLFAISDGWSNPSWRIKGRMYSARLFCRTINISEKKKSTRSLRRLNYFILWWYRTSSGTWQHREKENGREIFSKGREIFSSEKKSSPQTFPPFRFFAQSIIRVKGIKVGRNSFPDWKWMEDSVKLRIFDSRWQC